MKTKVIYRIKILLLTYLHAAIKMSLFIIFYAKHFPDVVFVNISALSPVLLLLIQLTYIMFISAEFYMIVSYVHKKGTYKAPYLHLNYKGLIKANENRRNIYSFKCILIILK